MHMPVADLLVIARLPIESVPPRNEPYDASQEIGSLVAAASWLPPGQVQDLTRRARELIKRS